MEKNSDNALSRRKFIKTTGLTGAALFLGVYFRGSTKAGEIITGTEAELIEVEMNAWILIDTAGKVTIVDHRAEMGQGSYQTVPQIVAEELEVDLKEVNIVFGQGNKEKYTDQMTGGSSTVRSSYKNLLNLSATAREMLIQAAAAKWSVSASECYARNGHVFHKSSGKKFHYGELVVDASKLQTPKNIQLKKPSDYKLIRKPLKRRDTPLKTNGSAIFGLDMRIPGMLYAMVERNPRMRGVVKSFDDSVTRQVPGVKNVFKIRMAVHDTFREGVAVIADTLWAAMQGRNVLKVEWDDSGFEHLSTDEIYNRMREALQTKEGLSFNTQGDPNNIIAKAVKKIDIIYETPYQAHYCMEPLNCIAHYQGEKLEIWGPIQAPDWVQDYLSQEMKLPKEKVMVNMTFLGGGFGRKAFLDYPHEAAVISKEIGGPVQVVWSREDDATQGPFRPGVSYRCEGVIENGEINAFKVKLAGQNINHWMGAGKDKPNDSASEGLLKPYFKSIRNLSIQDIPFETPIPIMWWRSVYASTNGFAFESFLDELAIEAGKDPLDFRRQHLKDKRCQHLIDKLEEVSGWKKRKKKQGFGVAITECFDSTVGQVVKVSRNMNGKVKIDKVWVVMDCGWYVNPDIIKAQVEGSVVMALGAACHHEITFKDGLAEQKNFYSYQIPRITDAPPVELHIMENDENAGGVGEPGLPPFTPALTNAIFDLTGNRIRKLPFDLTKL